MPTVIAAIVTDQAVTVVVDGQTKAITDSHPNYEKIRKLGIAGEYGPIGALLNIAEAIEEFGEGKVTVVGGEVFYEGRATHNAVTERILSMIDDGYKVGPMLRFLENLMDNPSFRAVKELYGFLEVSDLPITTDGHFLAYKMVRDDYTDHHSGKFDNSVGKKVSMPRNQVNEDANQTCSEGLHVCAQGYLGFYTRGGRTLLCKVNPRDVVSVPVDYKNAKMRTCAYTVIAEVDPDTKGGIVTDSVYAGPDASKPAKRAKPVAKDVAKATLAKDVISLDDAMAHFGCNRGALRKRLARGASAKLVFVRGEEMVQLLVDKEVATEADPMVMTYDDAMTYFGIERGSLRKRLDRGVSAERVMVDGEEMVKVLTD